MEENERHGRSLQTEADTVNDGFETVVADVNSLRPDLNPELFVIDSRVDPPEPIVSQDAKTPQSLLGEDTFPEGGLRAWLIVFGAWCGLYVL